MTVLLPSTTRLSDYFMLSDFMGSSTIYNRGICNVFEKAPLKIDPRLDHGKALAQMLDRVLDHYGPVSLSYGFISPHASQRIVTYQDPNKPSYHRWDIGAACDFIAHTWQLSPDGSAASSPVMLAHYLDRTLELPYSRLITYSESPFICLAANHDEIEAGEPRRAFYENRYMGKPKVKPGYIRMQDDTAKKRAFTALLKDGLPFDWRGAGYPTYHGGGIKQMHHHRVSKYTMVTDWLYDDICIQQGLRNTVRLIDKRVMAAFRRVGAVYDSLIEQLKVPRLSIVEGYLSPIHDEEGHRHWYHDKPKEFSIVPPRDEWGGDMICGVSYDELERRIPGVAFEPDRDKVRVIVDWKENA